MFNGVLTSGGRKATGPELRRPRLRNRSRQVLRPELSAGRLLTKPAAKRTAVVDYRPVKIDRASRGAARDGAAADLKADHRDGAGGGDAFTLYLREAGRVPLLSPEEEVALAARIQRGDQEARQQMICANLRLVVKIAREYEHLGLPLLDLINEGNLGLMRAVEKFDPAKGSKLSTYAGLWIRQQIRRALASQGKTIRLPVHVADRIYHLTQAEIRLRAMLGREPSEEELAHELSLTVPRLARLRRAAMRPASLDAPLGEEDSGTVADLVADEKVDTPYQQLQLKTETALVRDLIDRLPVREARILRWRFGLENGQEQTLETIGAKLKLTRERIRQLQNLALTRLRQMLEDPGHFPFTSQLEAQPE